MNLSLDTASKKIGTVAAIVIALGAIWHWEFRPLILFEFAEHIKEYNNDRCGELLPKYVRLDEARQALDGPMPLDMIGDFKEISDDKAKHKCTWENF